MILILIFLGAFLGGSLRYALSQYIGGYKATFCANMLACFIISLCSGHVLFTVGLAGALSTWSTLAKEIGILIEQKKYYYALIYILLSIMGGFLFYSLAGFINLL